MKLGELSARTQVTAASIKYYLRAGVLVPGEKRNATTAVYTERHVQRLTLITWLRRELGLSMAAIAELTAAIDDETMSNLELMGLAQRLAAGVGATVPSTGADRSAADAGARTGVGAPGFSSDTDCPESPRRGDVGGYADAVAAALSSLGWPDVSPSARHAVAAALQDLAEAGYTVDTATVTRHARALAEIARENTMPISDDLSRDEICLAVIRGITLHDRLLLSMSALVHAAMSASVRRPRD